MSEPSDAALLELASEVEWSLVAAFRHYLVMVVADRDGRDDVAQAAFDGAILHVRAVLEFLMETRGGHIMARHYCEDWDGDAEAGELGFDAFGLKQDLNFHAAHISRRRAGQSPQDAWDLMPQVAGVLALFDRLVACPELRYREELERASTEARLQFARVRSVLGS